jgi:hypothetical protein
MAILWSKIAWITAPENIDAFTFSVKLSPLGGRVMFATLGNKIH